MKLAALAASPAALFAAVAAAQALALISPGLDFAVMLRQTLAHGRAAGLRTALGIATGLSFHVGYSLFGFAWAIERVPGLLEVLRAGGAALLLYLGLTAMRAPKAATAPGPQVQRAASADFGIGFATNLFNAKAMLFFVALGSAIAASVTSLIWKLALGAWMIFATGAWFGFVAWALGHARIRTRLAAHRHGLDRLMGAILVALGLTLAWTLAAERGA